MSILQRFRSWLNVPSEAETEQTKDLYYNEQFFSGTQGLKTARYCQVPYGLSPYSDAEVKALPSAYLDNKSRASVRHGNATQEHLMTRQGPASVDYPAITPLASQQTIARLFLDQAKGYSNQSKWDAAIATCQKVLALDPQQLQAYRLMGKVYQAKENPCEAIGCYAEALTFHPEAAEIYSDLGGLYQSLQEWEQAIGYYQQALDLAPIATTPEAIAAVKVAQAGLIESQIQHQRQQTDIPHSVDAIYDSLSLSPETFTAQEHCEMAYLLLRQGDEDNAIESFNRAIQCQPSYTEAHLQLGALLEGRQQWQDAMFHYKQAVQEFALPEQTPLNQVQEQHRLLDATADARSKATANIRSDVTADHSQSFKSDLKDDAIADKRHSQPTQVSLTALPSSLTSAKPAVNNSADTDTSTSMAHLQESDPLLSSVQSFVSLAHSYEQHGDIEKAITHYRNALSLDPENQDIHQKLDVILAEQTA